MSFKHHIKKDKKLAKLACTFEGPILPILSSARPQYDKRPAWNTKFTRLDRNSSDVNKYKSAWDMLDYLPEEPQAESLDSLKRTTPVRRRKPRKKPKPVMLKPLAASPSPKRRESSSSKQQQDSKTGDIVVKRRDTFYDQKDFNGEFDDDVVGEDHAEAARLKALEEDRLLAEKMRNRASILESTEGQTVAAMEEDRPETIAEEKEQEAIAPMVEEEVASNEPTEQEEPSYEEEKGEDPPVEAETEVVEEEKAATVDDDDGFDFD